MSLNQTGHPWGWVIVLFLVIWWLLGAGMALGRGLVNWMLDQYGIWQIKRASRKLVRAIDNLKRELERANKK